MLHDRKVRPRPETLDQETRNAMLAIAAWEMVFGFPANPAALQAQINELVAAGATIPPARGEGPAVLQQGRRVA